MSALTGVFGLKGEPNTYPLDDYQIEGQSLRLPGGQEAYDGKAPIQVGTCKLAWAGAFDGLVTLNGGEVECELYPDGSGFCFRVRRHQVNFHKPPEGFDPADPKWNKLKPLCREFERTLTIQKPSTLYGFGRPAQNNVGHAAEQVAAAMGMSLQAAQEGLKSIARAIAKDPSLARKPGETDEQLRARLKGLKAPPMTAKDFEIRFVGDDVLDRERGLIKVGDSEAFWVEVGGLVALWWEDVPRLDCRDPGSASERAALMPLARDVFAAMLLGEFESHLVEWRPKGWPVA